MNPKELRYGNLIQSPDGTVQHVYLIEHRYKQVWRINDLTIDERTISDQWAPIPLNPDWLDRFCFTFYNGNKDWTLAIAGEEQDYSSLTYNERGQLWLDSFYYGETFGLHLSHIKSVHQLQNLYFALTGTELTLKP